MSVEETKVGEGLAIDATAWTAFFYIYLVAKVFSVADGI